MQIIIEADSIEEFVDRIAKAASRRLHPDDMKALAAEIVRQNANTEQLILKELSAIRRRLDEIYVPIQTEKNRQSAMMPVEQRKAAERARLKAKRQLQKQGGRHDQV